MTKNKKIYAAPVMHKQVFVPNDYAKMCYYSATFKVKCDISGDDPQPNTNNTNRHGVTKDYSGTIIGCTNEDYNQINYNEDGGYWEVEEKSSDYGWVNTTSPKIYYTQLESYTVEKSLHWETSSGSTVWHHQGHITSYTKDGKNLS